MYDFTQMLGIKPEKGTKKQTHRNRQQNGDYLSGGVGDQEGKGAIDGDEKRLDFGW